MTVMAPGIAEYRTIAVSWCRQDPCNNQPSYITLFIYLQVPLYNCILVTYQFITYIEKPKNIFIIPFLYEYLKFQNHCKFSIFFFYWIELIVKYSSHEKLKKFELRYHAILYTIFWTGILMNNYQRNIYWTIGKWARQNINSCAII